MSQEPRTGSGSDPGGTRLWRPIAVAALVVLTAGPVHADGDWFRHPFGELRSYHGDWLNVCPNEGRGLCRTVQIGLEPGETRVGPSRVALTRTGADGYSLDVYHRGMPATGLDPLIFEFDGQDIRIRPDQYRAGEGALANVAESLTITDPVLAADLVARMKAGNRLRIRYTGGEVSVSLRGVTAAITAIERHEKEQGE